MDESLFTTEAERGSAALRRLAYTWASDADELDDLVQLAWQLAWEKRATYRGDGDFVGWLLTIGRTACTRERKKRRHERTEPLSEGILSLAEADHISERRAQARDERDDELLNFVVRLPGRQRALMIAHYLFGKSVKQMAEMIGRSPETVKATLAQARRKLRDVRDESRKLGGGGGAKDGLTHLGTTTLLN
jgi:RNA polymerase sigma-70 factor (ECF subfamily)